MGPTTEASDAIHALKYRQRGETFRDAVNRISYALTDGPEHYHQLRDIIGSMRFFPAGRVQNAVGSARETTPYNCFVSGTIPDSFVDCDNPENSSIMGRATEAAETMRRGGGIGYDFSTLRPRHSLIRRLDSYSSGAVSFMGIFNAVCQNISSAGHRRGAQMAVLRVDHPDIVEFINAKHNNDALTGFNMSVAMTDEFMEAVEAKRPFPLRFKGEVYRTVDASELFEMIMRSTWDWAEPGTLFVDTINRMNNLWYCETIAATNPCGEQPLPPFGACLLGSFNLVKYLEKTAGGLWSFDWNQFAADIPLVVRAMDKVVDIAIYPLPQQEHEAKSKRRMGLGVMGLANAGEAVAGPYASPAFLEFEEKVHRFLANEAYRASALLAKEKGPFPLFDEELYLQGRFIAKLDDDVRDLIAEHGVRNSHLTSDAPTGTIAFAADYVSSGIEPVFALGVSRRPVNTPDGQKLFEVQDYGERVLGIRGKQSHEVTPDEHVDVLVTASRWVDSAVSKTCNMDGTVPWDKFKNIYKRAWEGGAKGCTTFNKDGKRFALLTAPATDDAQESESCKIDLVTGRRECH